MTALAETVADAEAIAGAIALVLGFISPCFSASFSRVPSVRENEMWSRLNCSGALRSCVPMAGFFISDG